MTSKIGQNLKKNVFKSSKTYFFQETIKIHVSRCLKENLKFVLENNEGNVWAYLFRLP